jgi:hypothetical protein
VSNRPDNLHVTWMDYRGPVTAQTVDKSCKNRPVPGDHHFALKVLQSLCLLVGDAGKNFVGFEAIREHQQHQLKCAQDWDPSMVFEFPENVINSKVHQVLIEGVLLHWNTEFVKVEHNGGETERCAQTE